jgi:phage terminase large subunit-like protein
MGLRGPGARPKSERVTPNQIVDFMERQDRARKDAKSWSDPNLSRAQKVINFIETLRVTSGALSGEPFTLRPWQRVIVEAWYRTDADGLRVVRTGLLSVARKNGKTGLCAALASCHLLGPEQEPRGQIVVGATDADQSGLIFDELCAFIRDNPTFDAECNIKRHEKKIEHIPSGSVFKALSSDAKKSHGLNPSVVILDELAQWGDGVGRGLYDALTTAQGARKEPLVFIIGTQAPQDAALMSQLIDHAKEVQKNPEIDSTFSGFVYEVPEDADVFDEAVWIQANPALGDFRSLQDLRVLAERAKRLPTLKASFQNLFLNQRISAETSLFTREEWQKCESKGPLKLGEEIYLGLDLSATTDLTALVAVSAKNGDRLKAWFWKPGDSLDEHKTRDKVPYDVWVEEGWIEAPKGRAIDYGYVARRIAQLGEQYKIIGMAYDRWNMKNLLKEFEQIGMRSHVDDAKEKHSGLRLVPWGQGYADMGPAVNALEISVLEDRLKHDGNPVLTFCVANAVVDMDAAGNRKLDKSATRFRIDGAVAAAMAIGLKYRESAPREKKYQLIFV